MALKNSAQPRYQSFRRNIARKTDIRNLMCLAEGRARSNKLPVAFRVATFWVHRTLLNCIQFIIYVYLDAARSVLTNKVTQSLIELTIGHSHLLKATHRKWNQIKMKLLFVDIEI